MASCRIPFVSPGSEEMATPAELHALVGRRARLVLSPEASAEPRVTGLVLGVIDAADGVVVFVRPNGAAPDARVTFHAHHIIVARPA